MRSPISMPPSRDVFESELSCGLPNTGSASSATRPNVVVSFIWYSLDRPRSVASTPRRGRREAQDGFIPESIFLAAFQHMLAAQRLAPFVLDEVPAFGIRLRDEFHFVGAILATVTVAGAGGFVAPSARLGLFRARAA